MSGGRFATTRWTLVARAAGPGERARRALEELCAQYWHPLYAFARRRGWGPDEARDRTQAYFAELLEKNWIDAADRDAGRFRTFLIATFKQTLSHERERLGALKREGSRDVVSLDAAAADDTERRYLRQVSPELTPDQQYERSWALTVLHRVERRMADEFAASRRSDQWDALSPFLTGAGDGATRSYRQIADALGSTEPAVKMAVRRLRKRFGAVLREEIAELVRDPADTDAELRHLLSALRDV